MSVRASQAPPKALISSSKMVLREIPASFIENLRDAYFGQVEADWEDGSPFKEWYHRVAQGSSAVRTTIADGRLTSGRLIAWKTGKPFKPDNLFFRTVDTCRLLPMSLANFRIQFYSTPGFWEWLEKREKEVETPLETWFASVLGILMHELLVMRNMHDFGGGDIPIILNRWSREEIAAAFDYWVELSKGKWSDEEAQAKYDEINHHRQPSSPCFHQADLLVRSLLSDPKVEYVPPFIVFLPCLIDGRSRVLFTDPTFVPPDELTRDFPKNCNSPGCKELVCGSFDFEECRTLVSGSALVRKTDFRQKKVRCNFWSCEVMEERGAIKKSIFSQCQRCKEVLYCSKEHQQRDWNSHKRVCEACS